MIKAVVFDCFGVLAEDGWLPFKRRHIGNDTELAEQVADLGKQNEHGYISTDEYFRKASELIGVDQVLLRDAVGKRAPNEELFEYIATHLKPRLKIGLLSNANFDVKVEIFEPAQSRLFDASVLSYESKIIKPDPRSFELIASRLGVAITDCLFIDDVERYCAVAEDLGMQSIVYKNPNQVISELNQFL